MDSLETTVANLGTAGLAGAGTRQRQAILRRAVDELVGVTFFAPMLKMAHNSAIKGKYGHGGRGEEIFQGQLDLELAKRAGRGMKSGLSETIYNRYVKRA